MDASSRLLKSASRNSPSLYKNKVYPKSNCMYLIRWLGGGAMTGSSRSRRSAAPYDLPAEHPAKSISVATMPISREDPAHGNKRSANTGSSHREEHPTAMVAVIEMWFCFVLGTACVSCGIMGLWVSHSESTSSIHFARLGSAYVPVLRATAVACLVLGAMLVRRGWAQP
jgi:hypothetical protein